MLDQERREHAQRVMERNGLSLDTILPQCESYADIKEYAKELTEGEFLKDAEAIGYTAEKWDEENVASMWDEWDKIIWPAIKYDHWICGATLGWCLHLMKEEYLASEKWHVPMPELH